MAFAILMQLEIILKNVERQLCSWLFTFLRKEGPVAQLPYFMLTRQISVAKHMVQIPLIRKLRSSIMELSYNVMNQILQLMLIFVSHLKCWSTSPVILTCLSKPGESLKYTANLITGGSKSTNLGIM